MAEEAADTYGLPRDIPAELALLEEVGRTAGHVSWLAGQVTSMGERDLVWGVVEQTERAGSNEDGGDGTVLDTKSKAVPSVWVELYLRERRHLVDVAAKVAGLNLDERREQRAERQTAQLALVVRAFIAALGLSADQQARVPDALRTAVASLTGNTPPRVIEG